MFLNKNLVHFFYKHLSYIEALQFIFKTSADKSKLSQSDYISYKWVDKPVWVWAELHLHRWCTKARKHS